MTTRIRLGMNECMECKRNLPINCFEKEGERVRKTCKACRLIKLNERREEIKIYNNNKLEYPEEKICSSCSILQPCTAFNRRSSSNDGLNPKCKKCYSKARKIQSPTQLKDTPLRKTCVYCNSEKSIDNFKKNNKSADGYYHKCNTCWKPTVWTNEKQKEASKRWCEKNKDKLRQKWKKASEKLQRIIKQRLCARIKSALKLQTSRKNSKTYEYIGCTYDFLKSWIEYQFIDGMSWDKMSEIHIDHVIPCESYNLTEDSEAFTCFNWKNLRPCWAKENLEKSSHIIPELIEKQRQMVITFLNTPLPNPPGDREGGTN